MIELVFILCFHTDHMHPVFRNCPQSQHVFAESNQTSAIVNWAAPTAADNSFDILRVIQTLGGSSGERFLEGVHLITYETEDSTGLKAVCQFNITVKGMNCLHWT